MANMSHELRTPLNHIIGFSDLVITCPTGNLSEIQKEYMQDVLFSSKHLLSLIEDVLDLSKIESGKIELTYSTFDVVELCSRSTSMVADSAMKKTIEIITELPDNPVPIKADERRVRQVIYNLLNNAVKFTPVGGTISLNGSVIENSSGILSIRISIKDSGIGIEKDNLERVFKPFEQLDNTLTKKHAGTGLGLSLTRTFVETHGGRIWVESAGIGHGSTFTAEIPLSP